MRIRIQKRQQPLAVSDGWGWRPRGKRWGAIVVLERWTERRERWKEGRWKRERCLVLQASCGGKCHSCGEGKKKKKQSWRWLIQLAFRVACSCRDHLYAVRQIFCEKGNRKQHFDWLWVFTPEPYWTVYSCYDLQTSPPHSNFFITQPPPPFFFSISCQRSVV